MPSPSADSGNVFQGSNSSSPAADYSDASNVSGRDLRDGGPIDLEPPQASGAVTKNAAIDRVADSPEAAAGRRTLSTAFVRVGPDGHLTVELRNGRVLVLRDVVMRPNVFCGLQVLGGPVGVKYCEDYAQVASANPGGAPATDGPDAAASNSGALQERPATAK